ncbi:YbaK/EbsC family protein, partial [Klebsiella pneumoniae]|nr:YbaK/EbsC family protein [Klebsiella pneumoniae]
SLREYDTVLPAAGSANSAVRLTPVRLAELTNAQWLDVTTQPV